MEVAEVKAALAGRALDVCMKLLPRGKREGSEWRVGSLSGEPGQSFGVCLSGAKAGVWSDFASGEGGDNMLELWREVRGLEFKAALRECKEFLGANPESEVRRPAAKTYKKPSKKGIGKLDTQGAIGTYLTRERCLSLKTLETFRIAQSGDEKIVFPFLSTKKDAEGRNELELLKFLALKREGGKKQVTCSAESKKVLFGKHIFTDGDRDLILTEGEIDAMSWLEIGYKATSVPFGAKRETAKGTNPNDEWIENDWEFLEEFERIFLSFDDDEEGQAAVRGLIARLGAERTYVVKLPRKDANKCLQDGLEEEMRKALASAKTIDPELLKNAEEFARDTEELLYSDSEAVQGIPLPFKSETGQFNFRMHEVTILSGMNGSGKTQWLNWLAIYFISVARRVMIASLEVKVAQTLRFMVSQVSGADKPCRETVFPGCINWLSRGLWFYDHVGHVKLKELLVAMRYAHRRYGVSFFFIDSLARLGIADDDYKGQKELLDSLTNFASELPVHVVLVVHSKKKESELDAGGKMDVKGSGSITDLAHNVWNVWRNKKKENQMRQFAFDRCEDFERQMAEVDERQYDAVASCHKQRNGTGEEPEIHLWYERNSRQYHTHRREPLVFVGAPDNLPPVTTIEEPPLDDAEPF